MLPEGLSARATSYLIEEAPVVALQFDGAGRCTWANEFARRVLGREAVGQDLEEVCVFFRGRPEVSELASRAEGLLDLRAGGGLPRSFRFQFWPSSGGALLLGHEDLEAVARLQREALVLNRELANLTRQLQRSKAELLRQNELKSEFMGMERLVTLAGGVAHHINNQLTVVLGYLDLSLAETSPGSSLARLLGLAREGSERAAKVSDQLLTFTGAVLQPSGCADARAVLVDLRDRLPAPAKVEVVFQLPSAPQWVAAAGKQLTQAVGALIENALEAIGGGEGQITVSLEAVELDPARLEALLHPAGAAPGPHVLIEVADTGPGMDEATFALAFDPFFTTRQAGRGLGLAVVLGLVRRLRGALDARTRLGVGSVVRFYLPSLTPS